MGEEWKSIVETSKKRKYKRKSQSELKNTIIEIKNTLKEINIRLDDTEEWIGDLKE